MNEQVTPTKEIKTVAVLVPYLVNPERDWTWIYFQDYPTDDVVTRLRELKAYHSSKRGNAFFIKAVVEPEIIRQAIEGSGNGHKPAKQEEEKEEAQASPDPIVSAEIRQAQRDQFQAEEMRTPTPEPEPEPKPTTNPKRAAQLRNLADAMTKQIKAKSGDGQNNTPRQRKQYRSRMHDIGQMERVQKALYALADAHESGTVPAELLELKTKKALFPLLHTLWDSSGGYYDGYDSGKFSDKSPAGTALQALISLSEDEQRKAKKALELTRIEEKARQYKIDGYFPTPENVVRQMLGHVSIDPGMDVLEPSAGTGNIADVLREQGVEPAVIECNWTLADVLEAKGYAVNRGDFLKHNVKYDLIVMNPPFEKGQDIDHVLHAFDCLNDGGQLVSIMSAGSFYRSDKKAKAFRDWVEELGAYSYQLPDDSFKPSGTNVSAYMLVASK